MFWYVDCNMSLIFNFAAIERDERRGPCQKKSKGFNALKNPTLENLHRRDISAEIYMVSDGAKGKPDVVNGTLRA